MQGMESKGGKKEDTGDGYTHVIILKDIKK